MTLRFLALFSAIVLAGCTPTVKAEEAVATPVATARAAESVGLKTAIFAGGCFWGVEGVFSHLNGVTSVVSGYHGGSAADATYDRVSAGETRHAEAVRVTYDPSVIRYDQLLQVYFGVIADPTLLNRQGPDIGAHYRTALVPLGREQGRVARAYLEQLRAARLWNRPIVTAIEAPQRFHPAEAYHQDFMAENPNHGYIRRWDAPKVANLRRLFPTLYKRTFTTG